MAFVREVISTEEDKNLYDELNLIETEARDKARVARLGLTTWVLDRERRIFMSPVGGGYSEIPITYLIVLPEGRLEFATQRNIKVVAPKQQHLNSNKSYAVIFQVEWVAIPPQLQTRRKELLDMIKETLAVDEGVDRPDGVLAVEVSFNPRITKE